MHDWSLRVSTLDKYFRVLNIFEKSFNACLTIKYLESCYCSTTSYCHWGPGPPSFGNQLSFVFCAGTFILLRVHIHLSPWRIYILLCMSLGFVLRLRWLMFVRPLLLVPVVWDFLGHHLLLFIPGIPLCVDAVYSGQLYPCQPVGWVEFLLISGDVAVGEFMRWIYYDLAFI